MSGHAFELICNEVNPFYSSHSLSARDWAKEDRDWLVRFAELNRLRCELVRNRSEGSPNGDWINEFSPWVRQHTFRVMQMVGEIGTISRALERTQVEAVFFKGAVLGEQIYGGPQNREFADIDVIVATEHRDEATKVLAELGYQPVVRDRLMRRAFFDYGGQHMHHNAETGSTVDLHWRFVGMGPFPLSAEEVLRNRTEISLGGARVPVASVEDLALILAGHGQKEGWASLGWTLDFAKFAAANPAFDWARALARARALKCERPLLAAFLLVERLFGFAIDTEILARAKDQHQVAAEVKSIIERYKALATRGTEDDLGSASRLCDTRLQRAKVFMALIVTRTIGDYEAMPLAPGLWWIYHITRPFRLAWRGLLGARRSKSTYWLEQAAAAKAGTLVGTKDRR